MVTQKIARHGPLAITMSLFGREVGVVSLTGDLDRSGVATAEEVFVAAVLRDCKVVVIDLRELEFIDSAGVPQSEGVAAED